ncbi:MAG: hypothetical protein QM496_04460 [Verrucomicrobiota bacterium]
MKSLITFALVALAFTSSAQQEKAVPVVGETYGKQSSSLGIQHEFLITGRVTALIGEDDKVIWTAPHRSRDGFVLGNGNILFSTGKEALEYTREGKVVFRYKLDPVNKELGTAVRLSSGRTLLVERGLKPRLIEVDSAGKIVSETPLKPDTDNAHMQTRMARKLESGNYLVPHLLGFAVKEYQPDGTVVKTFRTDLEKWGGRDAHTWPFTAVRLDNGNTYVNLTHGNRIVEFDADGKVVWYVDNKDVGGRFADPCGGQRLENGNTVICVYGQKKADMPKVFEITADKKVVWEYHHPRLTGIHEIHVVKTNGKSVKRALK